MYKPCEALLSYPDTRDEEASRLRELRNLMESQQVVESDWIKYGMQALTSSTIQVTNLNA